VSQSSIQKNISGRRIAEARAMAKPPLTQDDLSAKLALVGVQMDRAAVAKIENNLRRVLDYELKAIATALNVKVDWLLGGES
jgi:transcriptional regulator with XRE-family HTH domain